VRPEGLGKLKKIIHLIGSRTHDLSACILVLQPLSYRMALIQIIHNKCITILRPPLWSSGQSSWLQIRRNGFDSQHYQKKKKKKKSSGSGTGSTQPREYN
jgi:hypothetical protein